MVLLLLRLVSMQAGLFCTALQDRLRADCMMHVKARSLATNVLKSFHS